jgi:hypothetical protein
MAEELATMEVCRVAELLVTQARCHRIFCCRAFSGLRFQAENFCQFGNQSGV